MFAQLPKATDAQALDAFRSILAKTETHGQPELMRVILGLMDVALVPGARTGETEAAPGLAPLPVKAMLAGGGRRLEWIEFGDPGGRCKVQPALPGGASRCKCPAIPEGHAR